MSKKALGFCLTIFMALSLLPVGVLGAQAEGQEKNVVFSINKDSYYIGGNEVKTDVSPYIKNGRTMVPVAFVTPALGTEPAQWLPDDRIVKIKKDNREIVINIGSNELLVNREKLLMEATTVILLSKT